MSNAHFINSSSSVLSKKDKEHKSAFFSSADNSGMHLSEPETLHLDVPRTKGSFFAWNARITPSAVITVGVLQLILILAVFFFGFFVGKSTVPLGEPLELENLSAEGMSGQQTEEKTSDSNILPKEELRFMTSLKKEQGGGILSEQDKKPAPAEGAAPAATDSKKTALPKEPEQPKAPQFDYVLRVATFNDKESAQKLAAKLSKSGMTTRLTQVKTQKKTWHYVQVTLRGSAEDLQGTRAKLATFSLRDSMLISEKPVKKK